MHKQITRRAPGNLNACKELPRAKIAIRHGDTDVQVASGSAAAMMTLT